MITIDWFKKTCIKILGKDECTFRNIDLTKDMFSSICIAGVECFYHNKAVHERRIAILCLYSDGTSVASVYGYGERFSSNPTSWKFVFKRRLKAYSETHRRFVQKIAEFERNFFNDFRHTDESVAALLKKMYPYNESRDQDIQRVLEKLKPTE